MKTRLLALTSLFLQIAVFAPTIGIAQQTPGLLWSCPLVPDKKSYYLAGMITTPKTLLLQIGHENKTLAIDRGRGTVLWRSPTALIGTAGGQREVVILAVQERKEFQGDREEDYRIEFRQRLRGVDAVSGKTLWQDAGLVGNAPLNVRALGVYDGIIVLASWKGRPVLRYRDARTGAILDPSKPATAAHLKRASTRFPELVAWRTLIPSKDHSYLGREQSFLQPVGILTPTRPVITNASRILTVINMDNERAGGEADPKYIACKTPSGREIWKFPSLFLYAEDPTPTSEPRSSPVTEDRYRVDKCKFISGTDMVVAKDQGGTAYWLRAKDGKPIWPQLLHSVEVSDVVAYGKDLLALTYPKPRANTPSAKVTWLQRIERRTGTVTQTATIPYIGAIRVSGDTLYFISESVRAYSLRTLFPNPKPQPTIASRR